MISAATAPISPLRRARHRVRTHVSEHPSTYLRFARHKYPGPSPEVISEHTELVIDGYTRSASTFAVYAFQLAQPRPVRLAHHLHAPAQLIEAVHQGVPALLLIREPRGAVLSQLIREPGVAMRDALIAYCRFHTCLLRYRDGLVVGDFDEVTHDFGAVVRRLNARFQTSFIPFVNTEHNVKECLELIELRGTHSGLLLGFESGTVSANRARRERRRLTEERASVPNRDAWVPSSERELRKADLEQHWNRPGLARLRERAAALHRTFTEVAR